MDISNVLFTLTGDRKLLSISPVGITVDVKLGRKEYRGIVIAVGEECCTIPVYGCLESTRDA